MDPVSGIGLGLGAVQGIGNMFMQGQNNRQQSRAADTHYNWSTWMANTAHTREVEDLKMAGLNPNLSAGGTGAPTGGGTMPTFQAPQVSLPEVIPAITTMRQLDQNQQKIDTDKLMASSNVVKNLTNNELTKVKTILDKQGVSSKFLGTDLGVRAREVSHNIGRKTRDYIEGTKDWTGRAFNNDVNTIKSLGNAIKKYWTNPTPPRQQDSSAGDLP